MLIFKQIPNFLCHLCLQNLESFAIIVDRRFGELSVGLVRMLLFSVLCVTQESEVRELTTKT